MKKKGSKKVKNDFSVVDRRHSANADNRESGDQADRSTGDKPSYVKKLEHELEEKKLEIYSLATSIEGTRNRVSQEAQKDIERNRREIIVEFLDVLDNLNRAIESISNVDEKSPILEGVIMVRDQFMNKLSGFGVTRLEAMGQSFDPAKHEALTMVPTNDPRINGKIVDVIKDGYTIDDELLRPASVTVANIKAR